MACDSNMMFEMTYEISLDNFVDHLFELVDLLKFRP